MKLTIQNLSVEEWTDWLVVSIGQFDWLVWLVVSIGQFNRLVWLVASIDWLVWLVVLIGQFDALVWLVGLTGHFNWSVWLVGLTSRFDWSVWCWFDWSVMQIYVILITFIGSFVHRILCTTTIVTNVRLEHHPVKLSPYPPACQEPCWIAMVTWWYALLTSKYSQEWTG